VYSPSIWAGWYSGRYTEYKDAAAKEAAGVDRMLHIEWGGDSHAGRHSEDPDKVIARISTGQGVEEKDRAYLLTGGQARASRDGDWSETYICNLFDWHLKEQETMGFLAGAAQWVFKDFSTPDRPENPVPRVNQKGLLERDLTPKEGYYVFQSYWAEQPMAHIYGHSWPVRWGAPGEPKMVKVYSNCPFGRTVPEWKIVRRQAAQQPGFPGRRPALDGPVRHRGESPACGGEAGCGRSLRRNPLPVSDGKMGQARALDARHVVRFALSGDGELLQNLGTASGSRQVEMSNGRAAVRVRIPQGEAVLSIAAQGVPTAFHTLRA
jgi:beta-galactosidase